MNNYDFGQTVRISLEFRDADDVLTDPDDVTVVFEHQDGLAVMFTDADPEVVRESLGTYRIDYTPTLSGTWEYRTLGLLGSTQVATKQEFHVDPA